MSASHAAAERRGRFAEALCTIYLRMTGWRILARRLRSKRGSGLGEVDIVARRGATVAFIEVKSRRDMDQAIESVTAAQRARIARAADVYLRQRPELTACYARFDVMVLGRGLMPRHIVDAWRP